LGIPPEGLSAGLSQIERRDFGLTLSAAGAQRYRYVSR
jgi:hypothetical protein